MASSSSCVHNKSYVYDVFLSFCGVDTRKTFVDHLYAALDQHGICTFKDDERLEKGKKISDDLLQSIEESRLHIIVFSKNYASSSWCLDELLKIMECHTQNEQTAIPVFYDVEPTEVRNQIGSVGEALAVHTNKNESEVEKWREALKQAAALCGWDVRKTANGHEAQVIKLIVEHVSSNFSTIDLHADENLVGMKQRMQDLELCLEIGTNDVRMIGIKGMGGAGKTTLAWAIFNNLSMNFEGTCFVENVREKASQSGLEKLQEQVLRDVLKDNKITVSGVHEGKNLMKKRLCGRKVLVVLDDVSREEQLEALAGDPNWFKQGSRIIITTRDEQVLNIYTVKWIHEVNLLSSEEAIRLFSRHAFRKNVPTQEYESESRKVVHYAAGLPLTIKVLGSLLRGKTKPEWKDALSRLKTIPLKETLKILEISYESLEDDYKEIFLDVVCFLRGWWKEDEVIRLLESRGFHARNGLRVLEQKSLLTINNKGFGPFIQMHDHIVELGENIVRREHPDEPNRHSRLWVQEEIEQCLAHNLGTEATRCIEFDVTPDIVFENLGKMKNLECLIVHDGADVNILDDCGRINEDCQCFPNSLRYITWECYSHWCLPETFEANNLVTLDLPHSNITQLWEGGKVMKKLKFLDLSYNKKLRSLDLGQTPKLERLNIEGCKALVKLGVQGGCLKSLVYLNLNWCESLESISFIEQLESLEVLHIGDLDLQEFPTYVIAGHSSSNLRELDLSVNTRIEEVDSSIGNLHNLFSLNLAYCLQLKSLPGSICSLQHLTTLNLRSTSIEELPEDLGQLECLEELDLSYSKVKDLPASICKLKHLKTLILYKCNRLEKLPEDVGQLEALETLDLQFCDNLREIPNNSICKLKCLKELNLRGCRRLEKLPDEQGNLKCLQLLDIQYTAITHLPAGISVFKGLNVDFIHECFMYEPEKRQIQGFQNLKTLDLRRCGIEELPEALAQLECLEELNLSYTDVKHLPDSICVLKHLKKLILSRCGIEELPEAIGQLECLEELKLSYTDVKHLPDSICMLKHLKKLLLQRCVLLEKLPEDVGRLESLEVLDLSRCYYIREIPSSICVLKHLKKLQLEGCRRLEKLPDKLGELESLKELDIRATGITHLPWSSSLLRTKRKVFFDGELDTQVTGSSKKQKNH